jgi:hypothetical protein
MEVQYASLCRISLEYSVVSHTIKNNESVSTNKTRSTMQNNNEKQSERLQDQLSDVLNSIDDWMFYLQDLFGLKINVLRRALVHHLLTGTYMCA